MPWPALLMVAIALRAGDPPAAPPEPPPIPGTTQVAPSGTAPATAPTDGSGQSSATPTEATVAPAPPRRLWVILDYYKEFGGTVVREDEASITLKTTTGEERTVDRNSIVSAIPLLDEPEGTPVIVRWRNGRTIPAELVSDGFEEVVVRIERARTSLPRREILALEREPPFEEQLAGFRAKIPADAWDVRMELVRWLLAKHHPEIALEELREIRKNADSDEAARLMVRAEAEWELLQKSPKARAKADGAETTTRVELVPRLSDDDVNMIRVLETDLRSPPRMRHALELPTAMQERYPSHERMPPAGPERSGMQTWSTQRLLQLLFSMQARDLYGMVRIDEDPEHLRLFRKRVHDGWLIPNCATSRCHGGAAGGRLVLATTDSKSSRTAYTNLLVLLNFRTEQGRTLLDFERPKESILMGFGRPRNEAPVPHPAIAGWKPVATPLQKAMEEDATAWIGGMYRPRPDYPVKLEAPKVPGLVDDPAAPAAQPR